MTRPETPVATTPVTATPVLSITASPGATVTLYTDSDDFTPDSLGVAVAGAIGQYSISINTALKDGWYGFCVVAFDGPGNFSDASDLNWVPVDNADLEDLRLASVGNPDDYRPVYMDRLLATECQAGEVVRSIFMGQLVLA